MSTTSIWPRSSRPPRPKASFFDVVMLQLHVVMTGLWAVAALLAGFVAIPQLRRVPSALGLHVLQEKRDLLVNVLWATYLLTLSTGVYLMFKQAIYDPPWFGSSWDELEELPYGVPYYYALYVKIGLVLVMGVASFLLAAEARRAAQASEESGGPVDMDIDDEDADWLDEEVMPEDVDELELGEAADSSTLTATRTRALRRGLSSGFSLPVLWGSFVTVVVGLLGVGLCVTLIKYFHELSKAAVVYEILRGRGSASWLRRRCGPGPRRDDGRDARAGDRSNRSAGAPERPEPSARLRRGPPGAAPTTGRVKARVARRTTPLAPSTVAAARFHTT